MSRKPASPGRPRYRLRISLLDSDPEIWRTLDFDGTMRLDEVHDAIQIAFGWRESHLHEFIELDPHRSRRALPRIGRAPRRWRMDDPDDPDGAGDLDGPDAPETLSEREWTIEQVLTDFDGPMYYEYDFGDGWTHRIDLIEAQNDGDGEPRAVLVRGERRGPLEDSGGVFGYSEIIAALADPEHPDHDERRWWLSTTLGPWEEFDPEAFDPDHVNRELALRFDTPQADMSGLIVPGTPLTDEAPIVDLLARMPVPLRGELRAYLRRTAALDPIAIDERTASEMVRPFSWLLRRIGQDGITLTKAGWLPPALVSAAMDELSWSDRWIGAANREDITIPIRDLRENAQRLGLLRKLKGRLLPTATAKRVLDDPLALWRHLARALVLRAGSDAAADAVLLFALQIMDSRPTGLSAQGEPIAFGLEMLGWRRSDYRRLDEQDIRQLIQPTWHALIELGAFQRDRWNVGAVTDGGRMLARAMLQG